MNPVAKINTQTGRLLLPRYFALMRFGLAVLLVIIVLVLLGRSLFRSMVSARDGMIIYTATQAWLNGENPYDAEAFAIRFGQVLGEDSVKVDSALSLYPPSTYVLLAPWSLAPPHLARGVWTVVNLGFLLGLIVVFRRWSESLFHTNRRMAWAVPSMLVLGWAPVHSSFAMGQVSLVAFGLSVVGLCAWQGGRWYLAAVLLALSAAIKPQLGGLLVLLPALCGQWKPFAVAVVVGLFVLGAGAFRLSFAGVDWLPYWQANIERFQMGGYGDPTVGSTRRILMLGIPLMVHALTDMRTVASATGWLVTAAVIAWGWYAQRKAGCLSKSIDPLWLPALLATATLLPSYHRFYDVVLLLLPACWLLTRYRSPISRLPRVLLFVGLGSFFMIPNLQAVLSVFVEQRWPVLHDSRVWSFTAQINQTWSLLMVLAGMLMTGPLATVRPQPDATERPSGGLTTGALT